MLATLLPLLITIFVSELFSRPALIAQANTSMEADAQARVQTIANFFSQPIIDVNTFSRDAVFAHYLSGNDALATEATRVLATGYQHNTNYVNWSLIDAQGKQRLFYPKAAHPHGTYFISPEKMQQSNTPNGTAISPAYYNPQGNMLTVDLSEPVTVVDGNTTRVIGFVLATLNVSFIWNIIVDERGVNGNGSYAFIVDENGVIIAHSDMKQAFSAIAPLTVSEQQDINTQQYYGGISIPVRQYGALAEIQQHTHPQTPLQVVPPGQTTSFSVISKAVPIVPWTYFVLSPTDVVTALADQQLLITGMIASVVLCLSAATGLIVGRNITSPILDVVMKLQSSSQSLKDLADKEQVAATQQIWVIDASKTGLTTIDYYTSATQVAAQRLMEIGAVLQRRRFDVHLEEREEAFTHVITTARYIEHAVRCQKIDSMKLSDTIDLTKQVTEQLLSSAESATQAANQMERVVSQLQHVVGRE
jgi:hypothetical protein